MSTVLAVVAHPDDEILGCGGALARHAANGDDVVSLIMAEGATSRKDLDKSEHDQGVSVLRDAAQAAADCLGSGPPLFAGLPDNRMDTLDLLSIVQIVEKFLAEVRPDIVYTHHGGDVNVDHQLVHRAVVTASRPLPDCSVRKIYAFETASSTEWGSSAFGAPFQPTRFVDIEAYMPQKIAALEAYDVEMRPFPHPRSIENIKYLAGVRGASAGMQAAEAFEVVREYVK